MYITAEDIAGYPLYIGIWWCLGLDTCVISNQGVQNVNWFLHVFRERITDCWRQGWDDRFHERDRFSVYRIFKLEHSLEPDFYCVTNNALRDVFIRFRIGISEIKTHKLRCLTDPSDDLSCLLCKCCVDDEIHFLFVCKATEALSQIFCHKYTVRTGENN